MATIEWDSKFEVGNFEIDYQHRIFVKIIQKLDKEIQAGTDGEYIEALLRELLKYAEFHFCSEENLMLKNNFSCLKNHKHAHDLLLDELRNRLISLKFEYVDLNQLRVFLLDWFNNHTTSEDQNLATFLNDLEEVEDPLENQ